MSETNAKKVVIAGAGCAGLSAGIALRRYGFDVTIIEQSNRVGGLAGGIEFKGNIFEYGPHIFHTTDPEVLADVKLIAGHLLIPFEKTIKIKFLGKYFDFPLTARDMLFKLPPWTLVKAIFSFLKYFILGILKGEKHLTNSERVLQRYYGDVLYKIFFKDYITKVWGVEPKEMAASFAKQRIPRIDLFKTLTDLKKKIVRSPLKKVSTENYVEKHGGENFTTRKGFSLITQAYADYFQKIGGKLLLNATLMGINVKDNHCSVIFTSKHESTLAFDHFVSTIPIRNLPAMIEPSLEDSVLEAASQICFRGCIFVGIHVRKLRVLPVSFMYFRDKSFNRITDLAHFSVEMNPSGSTIVIAEITSQPGEDVWQNDDATAAMVIQELCQEGLLHKTEVIEYHIFKSSYTYPLYTVGYELHVQTVLNGLSRHGQIYSIGRQGKFAYINTHIAFKMGYEVAHKIAAKEKNSHQGIKQETEDSVVNVHKG